jgi:hypothetical protein
MKRNKMHCLTLRIDPQLDDLIADASYDRRTTKAAWIRAAIRQSLARTTERTGAKTK